MSEKIPAKKAAAPVIVIFGITGDLNKRKLLPALYHLLSQELLPEDTKIIGTSRKALDTKALLKDVELCVLEKDNVCDPAGLAKLETALITHQMDPTELAGYGGLKKLLDGFDAESSRPNRLFYMSIPSSAYKPVVSNLAAAGLKGPRERLLLEKPFGYSLKSAEGLIELLSEDFDESQVYRIDHYLAKETALNLLAFRLHNPIFLPLWNAEHIQRIHIRAAETLDIEGRAAFYEQTGALRDIIQSHLMQLLGITMMELPAAINSQAIHESKQLFLEQLQPADPELAVRGQYEGYRQEVKNPGSTVETYARLHLAHGTDRWRDTDIVLETGKALARKTTDIAIEFKTPHERRRNSLIFRIQPDEGISLDLVVKEPGFTDQMRHAALDFRYQETFQRSKHIDAYERVLMDAVRGDQTLFATDREVLATWKVLQPVIDDWESSGRGLQAYKPGSTGPKPDKG